MPKKRKQPQSRQHRQSPKTLRPAYQPSPLVDCSRSSGASIDHRHVVVARPGDIPVEFVQVPFSSLAGMDPQVLGVSYRVLVPAGEASPPVRLTVQGQHRGPDLGPGRTTFRVVEQVPSLPSGEATMTVRILDVAAGDWQVSIEPELQEPMPGWQPPRAFGRGRTGFAPVVRSRAPGVILGAWPLLVLLGVVLGGLTTALLARHLRLPSGEVLMAAAVSCVLGAAGAKAYFLALHRDRQAPGLWMNGMAVQGFVLVLLPSMVLTSAGLSLPVGRVIDVTVAGLLVGLAVGRIGCFYGGCCAGKPTASRWGRWSSDRVLGVRRIPTQLLESTAAGVLAVAATAFLWHDQGHTPGFLGLAGLAAYTAVRQLLFPLRSVPRTTRYGRSAILAATAVAVAAVTTILIRQG